MAKLDNEIKSCRHERLAPEVVDQTIGVYCMDCEYSLCVCWMDDHIPEKLWNRACATVYSGVLADAPFDSYEPGDVVACEQDRDDHCAVCGVKIVQRVFEEK